jgi:hypothetical protein
VAQAIQVHDMVAKSSLEAARGDFGPIMAIGVPAIMSNLATPVGSADRPNHRTEG